MTGRAAPALAGVAALIAALAICFNAGTPLDYNGPGCIPVRTCDDAGPAVDALAHGHVGRFFDEQRLMGPVSEVVRAPFVALAGSDPLTRYRLSLVPCLLAVALLGAALGRMAAQRGRPWWFQLLVAVGIVWNPITIWVVRFGHPEELLGGVLVVAAALALGARRMLLAGVLLGLAIATKLWALLALPLVVAAAVTRAARWRLLETAVFTAGVLIAIPAVTAPHVFSDNLHALGHIGSAPGTASRTDIWFPFVHGGVYKFLVLVGPSGLLKNVDEPSFSAPRAIGPVAHALVLLVAVAVAVALAARLRREGTPLLLLALAFVLLLRCVLDPGTRSYYHAPFLIAVASYEALVRRRLPWLAIAGGASVAAFSYAAPHITADWLLGVAYLAWSAPLTVAMGVELARGQPVAQPLTRR